MRRVEQESIEQELPDLGTAVDSWLSRVERESLRTSSNYEQGLDLLCQLVTKPDYKTLRESLEAARQSEEIREEYQRGKNLKTKFEKPPDASLLNELFAKKRSKLKSIIEMRLKALKNVGLNEENPQYPYLLELAVETAARGRMFGPLINKVSSWTGVATRGDTVELSNPQLFFTRLLQKTEYWRGFSDVASKNLDEYANSIFGKDAEKAKSLWKMLWSAKFSALGKDRITQILEKVGKPLIARNWEEAKKALSVIASYYPEILSKTDLEQLGLEPEKLIPFSEKKETARREKEELRAIKREQIKMIIEAVRSKPNIKGKTPDGETVTIEGTIRTTHGRKEYLVVKVPQREGQKIFYLTPETFLARLQSGEYIFSDLETELEK